MITRTPVCIPCVTRLSAVTAPVNWFYRRFSLRYWYWRSSACVKLQRRTCTFAVDRSSGRMSMCWVNEELHRIIRDFPLHFFLIFLPVTTSHGLRSLFPDCPLWNLWVTRHILRTTSSNFLYSPPSYYSDPHPRWTTDTKQVTWVMMHSVRHPREKFFYESDNRFTYYVSNLILFLCSWWYTSIHSNLMSEYLHLYRRLVLLSCIFSTWNDFS